MNAKERVLSWINKQRQKVGADPVMEFVKGIPLDTEHCLIASTFDYENFDVYEVNVVPSEKDNEDHSGPPYILYENEYDPDMPWGNLSFYAGEEYRNVRLPKYVAQFATDFDNGLLPELELYADSTLR